MKFRVKLHDIIPRYKWQKLPHKSSVSDSIPVKLLQCLQCGNINSTIATLSVVTEIGLQRCWSSPNIIRTNVIWQKAESLWQFHPTSRLYSLTVW